MGFQTECNPRACTPEVKKLGLFDSLQCSMLPLAHSPWRLDFLSGDYLNLLAELTSKNFFGKK